MQFKPGESFILTYRWNKSWKTYGAASLYCTSAVLSPAFQHLQVCARGLSDASLCPSEINWLNPTLSEMNSPWGMTFTLPFSAGTG